MMRRPLFYAAIFLAAVIFLWDFFKLPEFLPKDDISRQLGRAAGEVFLGGKIVSEIERKKTSYGEIHSAFILDGRRIWVNGDTEGKKASGRIRALVKNEAAGLRAGDIVVIRGELEAPKGRRNPGGFDYRAYLAGTGIRVLLYGDKKFYHKVLKREPGIPEWFLSAKQFLSRSISENFSGRDSAFLKALFLGERSELDEAFKDLFIKTGTMHILAVSGFNIGFLTAVLYFFLKPFSVSRNIRLLLTLAAVWGYCLLVGWQAPVLRASMMASVLILARLAGRRSDLLNSLGLAAIVILLWNPRQLFDVGFQLSFLAVYGLIQFVPSFVAKPQLLPNEKWTRREKGVFYFKESFWISFIALFVTLPVTVQNFYIVTPLSILANLIVVPLSFALFFAGIVYFLTFWWVPKFLFAAPLAMKLTMKLFTAALFAIENIPGSCVIVGKLDAALWAALTAGVFYLLSDKRISNPFIKAAALLFFSLNVFLAQDFIRNFHRDFAMTVLDVGQGDSIYLEFPRGGNMLIDAGKGPDADRGRFVVSPFLKSKGVRRIDALVISHPQEDHIGGMPAVLDEFRVTHAFDPGRPYRSYLYERLKEKIRKEKAEYLFPGSGMRLEGFRDVRVFVLNPSREAPPDRNINNDCLVLRVEHKNTSFLLTGDIEGVTMKKILERGLSVESTVLKVPHHGAKLDADGMAFVRKVNPKMSVISVGEKNLYGHPSPVTLEALSSVPGNQVFRTDRLGAVRISFDGPERLGLDSARPLAYDSNHAN